MWAKLLAFLGYCTLGLVFLVLGFLILVSNSEFMYFLGGLFCLFLVIVAAIKVSK